MGSQTCACRVVSRRCRTPPPQFVADVERFYFKEARRKATTTEFEHKTTGTYKATTQPRGRKHARTKWLLSYKTVKDGVIAKTKARIVAKGSSQMQNVDYIQTLARKRQSQFWRPLQMSKV